MIWGGSPIFRNIHMKQDEVYIGILLCKLFPINWAKALYGRNDCRILFELNFVTRSSPPPSIPSIYCAFSSYSGYDQMQLSRDRKSQPCTSSHQNIGPPIVLTNWGIMSLWKDRVGGRWQVSMADVIMPFCSQICFLNLQYTRSWYSYIYIYVWYKCKPHKGLGFHLQLWLSFGLLSQTTIRWWFQSCFIATFILGEWSNLTTVIVFKWAEITTFWWLCVCIAWTSHIMASWIANVVRIAMKFSRNPKHPMWNCDQSILVSIRWGSHNISQWWILEVVICRNLWKWRHIYLSYDRKSINCFCPCPMLSSCCIWMTHIFWGGFFASLSLFFSLYAYVFMHLYIEPFWRHSPDISMFQSNS